MDLLFITIGIIVLGYAGSMLLFPSLRGDDSSERTQQALKEIFESNQAGQMAGADDSILRSEFIDQEGWVGTIAKIPPFSSLYPLMMQAGLARQAGTYFILLITGWILLPLVMFTKDFGPIIAFVLVPIAIYFFFRFYCKRKIRRRNDDFINMFPDVLDMCVRSLRSGFPISAAMRMIAENMEPPVSTEFRQVVEEMESGRSVVESLSRMAKRVNEPDVNFFIVVLKVQQETGGNLAEVISNLSKIIRQRKHLRLKIKAMTSEGRTTSYILGSLPILIFGALYFLRKEYLEPLWTTTPGMIILGASIGLVISAIAIVNQMVKIEV